MDGDGDEGLPVDLSGLVEEGCFDLDASTSFGGVV
jgi:hypothetical protein